MGSLRTLLLGFGLCLPVATLAETTVSLPSDPLRHFATCTGRLSAEVEFSWLMSRPSEALETSRAHMIDLVDTLMVPGREVEVLALRIEAKMAQAALLTRAHFAKGDDQAPWALDQARMATRFCTEMLPG